MILVTGSAVLQQPGLVGAAAVVQQCVRIGREHELPVSLERRLGVPDLGGSGCERHRRRCRRGSKIPPRCRALMPESRRSLRRAARWRALASAAAGGPGRMAQ